MMSFMFTIIATILFAVTVNLSVGAPLVKRATTTQGINYTQFLGLGCGWTRAKTTQYLNNPGVVQSEFLIGKIDVLNVLYTNTNSFATVVLSFLNNQLHTKAQSSLNQNQYPINRTQFDQISMGMSQAQVVTLIGNEGQVATQSCNGSETRSYNANIGFAFIQISYMNAKVISKLQAGLAKK